MHGRKGLLHNLSILTVGQIVSQLANVAALVFLADILGPHRFGVIQIGVAFMSYALITAEWGMMSLGIREISRLDDPKTIFNYAATHCGMLALQAVFILGLGAVILPRLSFYHHDPFVFIIYLFMVIPQVYTQSWVAMGMERMKWVSISRIGRSLIYALLVFLVLPIFKGREGYELQRWVPAFFLIATIVSNLIVNIPLARWFGKFIHPRLPSWSQCKRRWIQTSSIGANTVILRVLFNIDLILLGVLASPEVAGNYAAAAKIIFFLVIAVEVFWAALLPRLSRLAKKSPLEFRNAFNLYFGTVTAMLLPIAVGGWFVGNDLIDLLYRGKFTEAGPVFRVLAISYAMLALATFLGNALLAQDRQKMYLSPLVASSAIAIIAIRMLVPEHGGLGASWGIIIAHGLLLVTLIVINMGNFNKLMAETLIGVIPGLLLMALVLNLVPHWHVVVQILVGGASYLALAMFPLLRLRRLSSLS
jgi:O-antigen/teichoic acid export membrane protein